MASGPNEPRYLKALGAAGEKRVLDNVTGDAGRDGFTRLAQRKRPERALYDFGFSGAPGQFDPPIGQQDYSRGPRHDEDY